MELFWPLLPNNQERNGQLIYYNSYKFSNINICCVLLYTVEESGVT